MTVKELMEELKEFNPNLPVARDAMEGEGSGVRIIHCVDVVTEPTEPWDHGIMDVVLIS